MNTYTIKIRTAPDETITMNVQAENEQDAIEEVKRINYAPDATLIYIK